MIDNFKHNCQKNMHMPSLENSCFPLLLLYIKLKIENTNYYKTIQIGKNDLNYFYLTNFRVNTRNNKL